MTKGLVEKYMEALGYEDITVFAEDCIRESWPRGYNRWKILKPALREFGWDLSTNEGYAKYWARAISTDSEAARDRVMKDLGIKEISDIPTMGRVFKHIWDNYLCPTEIVEESAERCVLRTLWCANPFYGPSPYGRHDCIRSYMEYYRNADAGMTRDSGLLGLAIHAKKRGLKEEVEVEMPWALCRDGEAPYCLYVFRKKGSPKYEPPVLTDRQKAWFIEDVIERSGEKPVVFVARMLGITIEEFAAKAFNLVVSLNTKEYSRWETYFGREKARDMYQKYWVSLLFHWLREAKEELQIGKVASLEDLSRIIVFCQRKKFIPFHVATGRGRFVLTAEVDPFVEIPTTVLGMKFDASYFDAAVLADEAFINQIIVATGMGDTASATVTRRLARGDIRNEIVIAEK